METFNGEKFPEHLKQLLIKSGYDSFLTLSKIDKDELTELEIFLNDNKTNITQDYCGHHNIPLKPFTFLPPHKKIILSIPSQIQQMKTKQPEMPSPTTRKKIKVAGGKRKSTPKQKDLKSDLVNKLKDFVQSISMELREGSMTDSNITGFKPLTDSKYSYECRFKCPFCQKFFLVFYKTNWIMANIRKHLRRHTNKGEESKVGTSSTEPRAGTSSTALSFLKLEYE